MEQKNFLGQQSFVNYFNKNRLLFIFLLFIIILFILSVTSNTYKYKYINDNDSESNFKQETIINNGRQAKIPEIETEPSNQAQDATFLNDMSEIEYAFRRYYQKNSFYPWQKNTNSETHLLTKVDGLILQELVDYGEMKTSFIDKINESGNQITLLYTDNEKIYLCTYPKSKKIADVTSEICLNDPNIKDTMMCNENQKQMCVSDDISFSDYFKDY